VLLQIRISLFGSFWDTAKLAVSFAGCLSYLKVGSSPSTLQLSVVAAEAPAKANMEDFWREVQISQSLCESNNCGYWKARQLLFQSFTLPEKKLAPEN